MQQRKWFVHVLVLVLGLSTLLAACSSKEKTPAETTAAPSTSVATEATEAPTPKEPVKLSILTTNANAPYAATVTNWAEDPYVKELSKISGYDLSFDFLSWDNLATDTTARFASGDLPDIVRTEGIESANHQGAVENGVFTDLTELIDQYGPNLKKMIPEYAWRSPDVNKNGKIYAIPGLVPNANTRALFIRQDWLDKLGLPMPKTLDDWLAYFEGVKNTDMNGNGKKDEYGFLVRQELANSEEFMYEFGVFPYWWKMVDGKFTPTVIMPEMKEAIKFWKNLYDKGYINPDAFTTASADWGASIQNGKAGSWGHYVDNYATHWNASFMVNQPDAKVAFAEPPVAKDGTQAFGSQGAGTYYVWVIPTKSKNAVEAIKFFDWAWSNPDAQNFFKFGIKDKNFTMDGDKVVYNPDDAINKENSASQVYQLILNMTGHALNSVETLPKTPIGEEMKKGFEISKKAVFTNDVMYMPPLPAITEHPELQVGFTSGSLLLDMFAKAVTGREDVDKAFDNFVAEWKKRGGDEWIAQATEWHNQNFK
ncbi:extracellular solute-binding protein [Paenibacillus eucommiae]|uniref:Aldouronate transport system substrate-binding protein n=1 Tax=Paenibacillus eucommiae TaxID=1355755 RepID=A0ABS4J035_9BACL|nr:extracellular solute-binding protein [Paenibacillus eucommiae]MBP1993199.1 putative aldouronate transport system substrate-binding protein [Paenibacillus eucommiae]